MLNRQLAKSEMDGQLPTTVSTYDTNNDASGTTEIEKSNGLLIIMNHRPQGLILSSDATILASSQHE
jgi:hypothetical protein